MDRGLSVSKNFFSEILSKRFSFVLAGSPKVPKSRVQGAVRISETLFRVRLFLMVSRKFSPGYLFYYIRPRVKRVK